MFDGEGNEGEVEEETDGNRKEREKPGIQVVNQVNTREEEIRYATSESKLESESESDKEDAVHVPRMKRRKKTKVT